VAKEDNSLPGSLSGGQRTAELRKENANHVKECHKNGGRKNRSAGLSLEEGGTEKKKNVKASRLIGNGEKRKSSSSFSCRRFKKEDGQTLMKAMVDEVGCRKNRKRGREWGVPGMGLGGLGK